MRVTTIGKTVLVVIVAAGCVLLGFHWYAAHRLVVARARFVRELGPLPRAVACSWPQTDPRSGGYWVLAAAARVPAAAPGFASLKQTVQRSPSAWSHDEIEQAGAVLEALRQPLATAYQGTALPFCDLHFPAAPGEKSPANPLMRLSRLLLADVGFALRHQQLQRAMRSTEALRALSVGLERPGEYVDELVGLRIEAKYLLALRWIVEEESVPTESLRRMRSQLRTAGERSTVAQVLAGEEKDWLAQSHDIPGWSARLYDFCFVDNDRMVMVHGFTELLAWSRLPYRQAQRAWGAHGDRYGSSGEIVWSMAAPTYLDFIGKWQATATARQLADIALGLRLDAAAQGRYPERLPEAYAVEVDPFAGTHPTYSRTGTGRAGAHLSNPAAAATYHQLEPWENAPILPFEWILPLPAARNANP
jgi:hypothetical protein